MLLRDIPVGHIARSNETGSIVLVGNTQGMYLSNAHLGVSYNINYFHDDYTDLGPLNVKVEEVKEYKVSVSVG